MNKVYTFSTVSGHIDEIEHDPDDDFVGIQSYA